MKHLYLFPVLLCFFLPVFGQNETDYLYLKTDTLSGSIRFNPNFPSEVVFSPATGGKRQRLKAAEGVTFTSDGRFFTAHMVEGEMHFLEQLVDGAADLYRQGKVFYIQKGEELHILRKQVVDNGHTRQTHNKYLGVLQVLFRDCPNLTVEEVAQTQFQVNALIRVVNAYNQCTAPDEASLIMHQKESLQIGKGVFIGTQYNHLKLISTDNRTLYGAEYTARPGYRIGVYMNLPLVKNRTFLQLELELSQKKANVFNVYSVDTLELEYNYSFLGPRILLKQVLFDGPGPFSLHLLGGMQIEILLSENSSLALLQRGISEDLSADVSSAPGLRYGLGITCALKKRRQLFADFIAENYKFGHFQHKVYGVRLGIGF